MTSPDPDVVARWVAALESGDYPPGRGVLCRVEADGTRTYCCLGVLTDLAVRAGVVVEQDVLGGNGCVRYGDGFEGAYLPSAVAAWAGLTARDPVVGDVHLSSLNDRGVSFARIAQLIREHV